MDRDVETGSQPDEYARDNHLSIDSRVSPFSLVLELSGSFPQVIPDAGPSGLTSDSFLPRFHLPTVDLREQLDIPKESIDLLAKALQYEDINANGYYETPLAQYETRKRLAELKFEPPALFSDPDYDCRELAKTIREQRQPNISPTTFPSERLDVANDEGLEFPQSSHQFRQNVDHAVHHEKLDVPREAIYHLVRALHDDWSVDENSRILEEMMSRRTAVRDLAVTPPLSPFFQHEEYFIPDAKVCEVPVAPDPSSMLSDDLKAAEYALKKRELEDAPPIPDIDTPQLSPLLDLPALSIELPKISSIKMSSPLSPITSLLLSSNEGPNIPALLESMDIDHTLSHPDSLEMDVGQTNDTDGTLDNSLRTTMEESAAAVMRSIEQEYINITDAIARVEVPIMDFSIPEPEWLALPMNARAHLKWLHESHRIEVPPCQRDSRADSQLRWVPFLQKIDSRTLTNEAVDGERDLSPLLNFDVKEAPTSADYVWKRPGLAILREPESEEDLEEVTSPVKPVYDLVSFARKRRLENSSVKTRVGLSPESDSSVELIAPSQKKGPLHQASKEDRVGLINLLPGAESDSAVSVLLSNYIDIRTAKRQKQDKSSFFSTTSKPEVDPQPLPMSKPSRSNEDISSRPKIIEQPQKRITPPAPCPELHISNAPTKLIKGLTLSRGLFSRLEQLYPAAEIIERDFDRWNTVTWGHHSVLRSPVVSSLAAEADVIVSPTTGIIVTTLLKVIQKPLPGRGGQSAIRERISSVALRYERLIVLVSEGNAVEEIVRDFMPSETTSYAEFSIFVAGLDTPVEVFYVGGGEATLATWLVFFAVQYAPEAAEVQEHLIQDETQWELFLRRAGFNAYAAQAILIHLKVTNNNSMEERECSEYSLAAFVKMTAVERVQRFRSLLGGEKVLNRVNRMLDMRWS
ncbi:hypothetical protein HD806DRAFT_482887 [Xylariaceae sp. AK1471]|nr:hypothetical protein HD806DRAFT_482887 [Xylariaceae sp. AK1471]